MVGAMNRRAAILREMGLVPVWRLRSSPAAERTDVEAPAPVSVSQPEPEPKQERVNPMLDVPVPSPAAGAVVAAGLDWDTLESAIRECRACRLHERRNKAVPGVGDRQADWLFVGEGPGAEEDQRGEPFVGQAGKLLDAMLAAIGLARGRNVYIANAVKCRPPGNRTPEADEIATCQPYLERQIELIQPRIIVALGRPAAQTLLGGEVKINAVRGRLLDHGGIPVVVTYHPAYLLRNPHDKAKAWEDLCFARASLG